MKTYEIQGYTADQITWDLIDKFNSTDACIEVTFDFCSGDKEWTVFCGNRNWLNKIRRAHDKEVAEHGESKIILDDVDFYNGAPRGFFFKMPIKYLKFYTPKFMSEEKRAEAAERFKNLLGNKKSDNIDADDADDTDD